MTTNYQQRDSHMVPPTASQCSDKYADGRRERNYHLVTWALLQCLDEMGIGQNENEGLEDSSLVEMEGIGGGRHTNS